MIRRRDWSLYGDCGEPSETGPGIDRGVSRRRSWASDLETPAPRRGTAQPSRPDPRRRCRRPVGDRYRPRRGRPGCPPRASEGDRSVRTCPGARGVLDRNTAHNGGRDRNGCDDRAGADDIDRAGRPGARRDEHHFGTEYVDVRAGGRRAELAPHRIRLEPPAGLDRRLPSRASRLSGPDAPRTEARRDLCAAGRHSGAGCVRPRPRARPRGGRDVLHTCASELLSEHPGHPGGRAMVRLRRLLRLRHTGRRLRGDLRLHGDGPRLQLAIRARAVHPRTSRSQR